ncbi:MAG: helix-turn-helix domain-containing protein [Pelagibacteraceae bacterium]
MHNQIIKPKILSLNKEEFNKALLEIKDYLSFSLTVCSEISTSISLSNFDAILTTIEMLKEEKVSKFIEESKNKLLITNKNETTSFPYDDLISAPINVNELNQKILNMISSKRFNLNSSIKIKKYILDKNEKKLKKENLFIIITEKEIQLLELLLFENSPIPKKKILNKIWRYSPDADTHTVETHIYRLRKKIVEKFKDEQLICNSKKGYFI